MPPGQALPQYQPQDEGVEEIDVSLNDIEHLRWVTAFPLLKGLAAFACKLPGVVGIEKYVRAVRAAPCNDNECTAVQSGWRRYFFDKTPSRMSGPWESFEAFVCCGWTGTG